MIKKVSDLIADFLAEKGIKHVFGIIGSGNAHIFDSITQRGFTQVICVHHEQAAVMAMQTYFRVTGRISASIVTTGAGSTNAVTGVVSAWMDSIPGIIISGNENSRFTEEANPLRIWGIQGYDSTQMVSKVTKYAHRLKEAKAVTFELNKSYAIASTGRPGPVWLDIPMNIQAAPVNSDDLLQWNGLSELPPHKQPSLTEGLVTDVNEAATYTSLLLEKSERPVIWLGHGIRLANASELVRPLVEKLGVPVLVSWAGMDIIDSNHPLVFGRAGIYGQRAANFVLQNSDLLITIGTRLAVPQIGYEISEFARAAKIVSVDIDPIEVRKHGNKINIPVCADARDFINALNEIVSARARLPRPNWLRQCEDYRNRYPTLGPEHADQGQFINSYKFMKRIEVHFKPKQIVVTDMGTALLSGHQILNFKAGQRMMTSTGLGEMGYGLPAAIGAAIADLEQGGQGDVICLNCDGGMMMNLQELQTIVHHKLPIKIVIFNNDGYLMIKHTQKALFKGRYAGTDTESGVSCPDYSKVSSAFEIPYHQVHSWEEFDHAIPAMQNAKGPAICEVFMHPEQLFVPKLSLAPQTDGSIVSPPLEDLSPLLSRDEMKLNMIIGLHQKSEKL